jgi:hypothetical protein
VRRRIRIGRSEAHFVVRFDMKEQNIEQLDVADGGGKQ